MSSSSSRALPPPGPLKLKAQAQTLLFTPLHIIFDRASIDSVQSETENLKSLSEPRTEQGSYFPKCGNRESMNLDSALYIVYTTQLTYCALLYILYYFCFHIMLQLSWVTFTLVRTFKQLPSIQCLCGSNRKENVWATIRVSRQENFSFYCLIY